jgi:chromosome segregation ATPase
METIVRENAYYKDEIKHRLEYLDECLKVCQSNKNLLDQAFETSFEVLSEEFNNIYAMLKAREAHLKDILRTMYT